MNDVQLGRRFRALRLRLGWRQEDLATRAGVSQDVISLMERGRLERVSIKMIRRVTQALDAELSMTVRWRGGDLDRLVDEGHAGLIGAVVELLRRLGWQVRAEVSYSEYGERGSIDILAWHPASRTLLVIEVKTELTSVEETLRKHDEKARLASRVALKQFGWHPRTTSRLLVLPDLSTPRRRVERHAAVLAVAYPVRGIAVRSWLGTPVDAISGLLFVAARSARTGISRKRVRCRKAA
jgi:transcriptional regulator with XRE-family HTH domain